MAKKIRFPLEMDNGVEVRSLEELRNNFSLVKVLEYLENGKLIIWLHDRYESEIAGKIEKIDKSSSELPRIISEILGIEFNEQIEVTLRISEEKAQRLKRLKEFTNEERFITNLDNVAFDQDELYDLLDEKTEEIYLCGDVFKIPLSVKNVKYIGINSPMVMIDSNIEVNWMEKCINLENIRFDEKYQNIIALNNIDDAEKLFLNNKIDEAYELFLKLANMGNGRAMYFLGEIYSHGFGSFQCDKSAGRDWRYKGYKKEDVLSTINYAFSLEDRTQKFELISSCVPKLKDEAKKNVFAKYELACLYENAFYAGDSEKTYIEKDTNRLLNLLGECAEEGYWNAANKLGNLYINGDIVSKNSNEAVKYYSIAANLEYGWAEFNLANCYFDGDGVSQDYKLALEWYTKASNHEIGAAANKIGLMYYFGQGVEKSPENENKWFLLGAELGNESAQYNYGLNCKEGWGIEKDIDKAFRYFLLAAEKGYAAAQNEVGIAYLEGNAVERNYEKSVKYFTLAAEKGYADAQNRLGVRYSNGQGVEKNEEKAFYWFSEAGAQGHEKAIDNLLGNCDFIDKKNFITARKGWIYFSKLRAENFVDRFYEILACNYQKNIVCLYEEVHESSFAPSFESVQNNKHLIISIKNLDRAKVLQIINNSSKVVTEWSASSASGVYMELTDDILSIYEKGIFNDNTHIKTVTLK